MVSARHREVALDPRQVARRATYPHLLGIAQFGLQVRVEYPLDTFLDAPPELRFHYTRMAAELASFDLKGRPEHPARTESAGIRMAPRGNRFLCKRTWNRPSVVPSAELRDAGGAVDRRRARVAKNRFVPPRRFPFACARQTATQAANAMVK